MTRATPLSLTAQLLLLRKYQPTGRGTVAASREGRRLRWHQSVRPHALGALYEIELRYVEGNLPQVLVCHPDLRALADGRKIPHTYPDVDGHPCLCLWWIGDWKFSLPVATTMIPWAAEWFWFFEHWLTAGEWLGGGTHPVDICPPVFALTRDQHAA
jgi:hypothetical protein